MAVRDYWAVFGSGAPSSASGLNPTFIAFINGGGSNITPPSISEPGSKGLYRFQYDATQTIAFVLDGATTALASSSRYVVGVLDPQDQIGVTVLAIGVTTSAIGSTLAGIGSSLVGLGSTLQFLGAGLTQIVNSIGSTASSFGSTSIDPTDLFGFLKRSQEFQEGARTYTKSSGTLQFFDRGASTLLVEQTVTDSTTQTNRT